MTEPTHFIIDCLSVHYGINVAAISQLHIGADVNASIYKVKASDQKSYFVKLKQRHFHDVQIEILTLLQTAGIEQIILPIKTIKSKQLYQTGDLALIVYPFIKGEDGFNRNLTDEQWIVLGRALRQVHEIKVPSSLKSSIRREDFSPQWREAVRSFYNLVEKLPIGDEVAINLWKYLKENQSMILQLVDRSEQLAKKAIRQSLDLVVCHSDIHAGNVLLDDKDHLYIVDWDAPIMAPKERDLMFIGGGIGNVWNNPQQERLFYQGYGQVDVDLTLFAYYRCERIVEDIAEYIDELLLKPSNNKDRLLMYTQFMSMFAPHGVVEIALATANT